MTFFTVQLKLIGTWCHDWPNLRITANDRMYFDGQIENAITINFDVPLEDHNKIILQHYGKNFGQNGQWDTVSENGVIVQDRAVRLVSMCLDEIELRDYLVHNCHFTSDQGQVLNTDYYGFNGKIELAFGSPIYDWIIDTILKPNSRMLFDLAQPLDTTGANLFDYDRDLRELEDLERYLEHHAYLFGKFTKI